jgi:hypothetical protein
MLVPSTSNRWYSAVFNIIGMKYKATLRYWSRSFRVLHSSPHMFPWLHKCLRNTIFTMFETHEFHVPETIFTSVWDTIFTMSETHNFRTCLRHIFHKCLRYNFLECLRQFSQVSETIFTSVWDTNSTNVWDTVFRSVWDTTSTNVWDNFHKCLEHKFHKCLRHNFQKGLRHSFHKCLRHTIFNDVRPLINTKCDDREAKLQRHSCGIWRHVVQCRNTDVSEESSGPIYRVVTANGTWNHTCFLRYS